MWCIFRARNGHLYRYMLKESHFHHYFKSWMDSEYRLTVFFPTFNFLFHLCGLPPFLHTIFRVYTIYYIVAWIVDSEYVKKLLPTQQIISKYSIKLSIQKKWLVRFIWCTVKIHQFCVIYSDFIHSECNCYLFSSTWWCVCHGTFIRLDWIAFAILFFSKRIQTIRYLSDTKQSVSFAHSMNNSVKFNIYTLHTIGVMEIAWNIVDFSAWLICDEFYLMQTYSTIFNLNNIYWQNNCVDFWWTKSLAHFFFLRTMNWKLFSDWQCFRDKKKNQMADGTFRIDWFAEIRRKQKHHNLLESIFK